LYEKAARKKNVKLTPGGSMGPRYVWQLSFTKNQRIAINSTTTEARKNMCRYGILTIKKIDVRLTKLKKIQCY
jgi:hypothetical protein